MRGYGRKGSGGGAIPGDTGPAEHAAQRAGVPLGGDALYGLQHALRAAQGSGHPPIKKLCGGLDMSLGAFFSARVFDELKRQIKLAAIKVT